MDTYFDFYEKIVDGWERTETTNGVPYYSNHKTERTSWDHPYWLKILEGLKEFDTVKYAAYRTSLKIRHLQKQLHLNQIELYTLRQEFEELGHTEGTWESIHCDDLLLLLGNMYRNSHASYSKQDEPEMLADVTLNLLLNLFDLNKTGFVKVMSIKFILATLSAAKLTEKYRFYYQELHDPSTYISSRVLTTFMESMMKLPDFLHESLAFGRTCEPAVASCCQMGRESGGITEDVFYKWLQKEPQTLVWLPTLHRVINTENLSHVAKCSVCKTSPIIGFRYKCLKCFNFDLCQTCFFTGKIKKKHKVSHPIQEYCLNSTTKDDTTAFVKTLKNNLSRKHSRRSRLKYLPIEADSQYTNHAWSPGQQPIEPDIHEEISETARRLADMESSVGCHDNERDQRSYQHPLLENVILSPKDDGLQEQREELNTIIQQLEEENRALYDQLCNMKDVNEEGDADGQTQDMKTLQQKLKERENFPVREPLPSEATPIYLSVPIMSLNGSHMTSYSDTPRSNVTASGSRSAFRQPNFSSPESAVSSSPAYIQYKDTSHLSDMDDSTAPNQWGYSSATLTPPRTITLGDSVDNLDASPSKFSLPSPARSHNNFQAEEAELEAIVDNVGKMFPPNLSYSGYPGSRLSAGDDEMLLAANSIGTAMSDLVNKAVNVHLPEKDV